MDWIKVMCNILDHRKIKMIRKGPEGNTLVLLWILMLTEAGKSNRGGYLMVTDDLPYSLETLAMVTDIPLATVQLALSIFEGLKMIDHRDGAIFILNWGKYQSEDKLEARRENDRLRKQRQRERERGKLLLPIPVEKSRDSHAPMSRDVTLKNREDKRIEKTTTDLRTIMAGTPFFQMSDHELQALVRRHGKKRMQQAADIAAKTWRRRDPTNKEISNPGGYLQALCCSHVTPPSWYEPSEVSGLLIGDQCGEGILPPLKAKQDEDVAGEEEMQRKNEYWSSLSLGELEGYCSEAIASMPSGFSWPKAAIDSLAKTIAWERRS